MTNLAPTLPLPSGGAMPQVALGTWPMNDAETEQAGLQAIELGYRHFDTAENYENEAGVGAAVRKCGLDRGEVFVTTKFNREFHADPAAGVAGNLERLGLDYADLILIHWPNPDQDLYVKAWEGLLQIREKGLARAVGTSNFTPDQIDRLIDATGVTPEVNQIEMHPYYDRSIERAYHAEKGIITEAWSPLGRDSTLRNEALVGQLAEKYGKTPGQVVLRWGIEVGAAVSPKSADRKRQLDNLTIFDFGLDASEVEALTALQPPADYPAPLDPKTFGH